MMPTVYIATYADGYHPASDNLVSADATLVHANANASGTGDGDFRVATTPEGALAMLEAREGAPPRIFELAVYPHDVTVQFGELLHVRRAGVTRELPAPE